MKWASNAGKVEKCAVCMFLMFCNKHVINIVVEIIVCIARHKTLFLKAKWLLYSIFAVSTQFGENMYLLPFDFGEAYKRRIQNLKVSGS